MNFTVYKDPWVFTGCNAPSNVFYSLCFTNTYIKIEQCRSCAWYEKKMLDLVVDGGESWEGPKPSCKILLPACKILAKTSEKMSECLCHVHIPLPVSLNTEY